MWVVLTTMEYPNMGVGNNTIHILTYNILMLYAAVRR